MQCPKCNGEGEISDTHDLRRSCPRCHGTGEITPGLKIECPTCEGTGQINRPRSIEDRDRSFEEREPRRNGDSLPIEDRWTEPDKSFESIKCPRCHGTGKLNSQTWDGNEPYHGDGNVSSRKRNES
jgi:RecJ-like exonuclease